MKAILILASLFMIVTGCVAPCKSPYVDYRITEYEAAQYYVAMQPMCLEDAYTIGFASGYFGNEQWAVMIQAMKDRRAELIKKRMEIRKQQEDKP